MPKPIAEKPVHRITDYPAESGGMALSLQIDVTHVAAYYQYDPICARYVRFANSWPKLNGTPYLPNPPQTEEEYFDWMQNFKLPAELRFTAERAAGPLAESLEHLSQRLVHRDLVNGRLDRYKLADVGKAAALGTYSDESVRPYRRTEYRDAYTPTVAIVAAIPTSATGWRNDRHYSPRLVTLTLAVLWACEAAGIQAQAALVQGRTAREFNYWGVGLYGGYRDVVQGFMLTSSETVIPARAYGIFLNDHMWMHMKVHVKACRYDYASVICGLDGDKVEDGGILGHFPTMSGGNAVHWARQILGADIVIAIGDILDSDNADVAFDTDFTVEQAIQMVAKKAAKL